jgi:probable rRNA maturation factor
MKNVACVHVTNHHRKFKIDRKKIIQIATEISRRLGVVQYEICIQFVSPVKMKRLNNQYRHQDKSTDVLSFPQYTWKRPLKVKKNPTAPIKVINPLPLGDVVISPTDASKNIKDQSEGLDREICFLVIHGILHLVGHDHMKATEKRRMFTEQKKLMRIFSGGRSKNPVWHGCVSFAKSKSLDKKSGTKKSPPRKRRK